MFNPKHDGYAAYALYPVVSHNYEKMTFRFPIKCKICDFESLVKVQAGFLEKASVRIGCPNCGSLLNGELIQEPPNVSLNFDNAEHTDGENLANDIPIIPISTELPIPKKSTEIVEGSLAFTYNPYIAFGDSLSYDKIALFRDKYLGFAKFRDENVDSVENIITLFQGKKYNLVISESKKYFAKIVPEINKDFEENIDSCYYIISKILKFFILNAIPKNYENSYTIRLLNKGTINKIQTDKAALIHLKTELNKFFEIEREFISSCKILVQFIKNSPSYVPVIALSYIGFDEVFDKKFGITTFSFDELKDNYKDSFELLARSSILYVGFSNFAKHKNEDNFSTISNCNSLNNYYNLNNGLKKQVIEQYPLLKKYYRFLLDSQIRNAIGHAKTEFFMHEQLIKYYPYTDLKKINKFKEKSLVDFAYHTFLMKLAVLDLVDFIGKWHYRMK
ncbi:hypothetical protein ZORO111903_09840 [Zobellia roscoffensis]|uniref:hypothetical protein n=1 Tax=Zobellia roscoffensis TaxID=2779508 RepID=UPI00188CC570|nr:hypothetical protein [Zobellia roscoffensis]